MTRIFPKEMPKPSHQREVKTTRIMTRIPFTSGDRHFNLWKKKQIRKRRNDFTIVQRGSLKVNHVDMREIDKRLLKLMSKIVYQLLQNLNHTFQPGISNMKRQNMIHHTPILNVSMKKIYIGILFPCHLWPLDLDLATTSSRRMTICSTFKSRDLISSLTTKIWKSILPDLSLFQNLSGSFRIKVFHHKKIEYFVPTHILY